MGVTGPTAARDVPGGARDLWEGTGAMDSACGEGTEIGGVGNAIAKVNYWG